MSEKSSKAPGHGVQQPKVHARRHKILMVSDFFYPRLGGVEMHIWSLSQCLRSAGHKVVVLTREVDDRRGVRWMTNGLKVYYLPCLVVGAIQVPTFVCNFPLFRHIVLRESITLVHCHQSASPLAHACMMHAGTMGLPIAYTEHSLFGFNDISSIWLNQLMKFSLSFVDHSIAVSHTCRENLVMRAKVDARLVSAIPNAIESSRFKPDLSRRGDGMNISERLNIIMLSRLVYRKGLHVAAKVIPKVCKAFPNAHFIIGGDGPMKLNLLEMIEENQLFDRVELLGAVQHSAVRSVLTRGHVFFNCSLTESFCIAILEAACCGLHVVSTDVGGIPEVLPPSDITFSSANAESLEAALVQTLSRARHFTHPLEIHRRVKDYYSWHDVAGRTLKIYDDISSRPRMSSKERLCRILRSMHWAFYTFTLVVIAWDYLLFRLLKWLQPATDIERAQGLHQLESHNRRSIKKRRGRGRN